MPNQSPWIWKNGKASPLPNVMEINGQDIVQSDFDTLKGGSIKTAQLNIFVSGLTQRKDVTVTPYLINSAPNDGSTLAGNVPTGSGTGGAVGGSAPGLGGSGGTLAGSTASGSGSVPTGSGTTPLPSGSGLDIENAHEIRISVDVGFESPTTSVLTTLTSTDVSGDFHNVAITDGSADIRLTKAPNEQIQATVASGQNADTKITSRKQLNFSSTGLTLQRIATRTPFLTGARTCTPVLANGSYYYFGLNAAGFAKLMKVNASTYAVSQVSNTANNNYSADAVSLTMLAANGNAVYFPGINSNGVVKLYKVDATTDAITLMTNTANSVSTADLGTTALPWMTRCGDGYYFWANNASGVNKLFRLTDLDVCSSASNTRGNNAITDFAFNLSDVSNGAITEAYLNAGIVVGTKMYFVANNSNGVAKLFVIDSGTGTITQVSNTANNQASADISTSTFSFFTVGTKLFFTANNQNSAIKLYEVDTTTDVVTQISDIRNNQTLSDFSTIVRRFFVNGTDVFFFGNNSSNALKIIRLDTTSNAFTIASNTKNNAASSDFNSANQMLGIKSGKLIFIANNASGSFLKLYAMNTTTLAITTLSNTRGSTGVSDALAPILDGNNASIITKCLETTNCFLFTGSNVFGRTTAFAVDCTDDSLVMFDDYGAFSLSTGRGLAYNGRAFIQLTRDNASFVYEFLPASGQIRRALNLNRGNMYQGDQAVPQVQVAGLGVFISAAWETFINRDYVGLGGTYLLR